MHACCFFLATVRGVRFRCNTKYSEILTQTPTVWHGKFAQARLKFWTSITKSLKDDLKSLTTYRVKANHQFRNFNDNLTREILVMLVGQNFQLWLSRWQSAVQHQMSSGVAVTQRCHVPHPPNKWLDLTIQHRTQCIHDTKYLTHAPASTRYGKLSPAVDSVQSVHIRRKAGSFWHS
jgi:hypothetical protein